MTSVDLCFPRDNWKPPFIGALLLFCAQLFTSVLPYSNNMGLELSEIEGDAILFYKFGDTPDIKESLNNFETDSMRGSQSVSPHDCVESLHSKIFVFKS